VLLHLVSENPSGSVKADVKVGGGDPERCRDGPRIAALEIDQLNDLGIRWPKLTKKLSCASARGVRGRLASFVDSINLGDRFYDIRGARPIVIDDRAAEDAVEPSSRAGWVL
jgi:hypothetical protein